tara:strand:+ start:94 stop:321 length:228 start_codon:yes stop_codon:yes gene_type:complete
MMLGTTEDGWIYFEDGSSCSDPEFEIVTRDGKIVAIDVQRTIEGGDDSEAALHATEDAIQLRASIDDILSRRVFH